MRNNNLHQCDPDEQSNFNQCINSFSAQMQIRLQKIIQCITKILTDLARIMLVLNISNLPSFPRNILSTNCDKAVQKFLLNMRKWALNKKANHRKITTANLDTQARQQYDEECDFFASCFVTMNNYMENCVALCIETQPNVDYLHHISSLLMIRYALIVFKRKIQWNPKSGNFPIFRYKAAVTSSALHNELDGRYSTLCIAKWIKNREAISKSNGTRAIGAKKFWLNLIKYLECVYHETYHVLTQKINLDISNEIGFDDQHITVCDALHIANNIEKKRKEILSYFEPEQSEQKMTENLSTTSIINNQWRYDIDHNDCDTKIAHLQHQNDELQAEIYSLQQDKDESQCKINTLQQDKCALEAKVQRLQHQMQQMSSQLNGYQYRERVRFRPFQSVHYQTTRNKPHRLQSHIQSLQTNMNYAYPPYQNQ